MNQNFGRYFHCYSKIKKAWNQILEHVSKNYVRVFSSIKDGASEEEIQQAEMKSGLTFPDDLRCSLRLHNGQGLVSEGLLGSMSIHNHYRSEQLLAIGFGVRCEFKMAGCVPLTLCIDSGVAQHIAIKGVSGLEPGTVFYACDVVTKKGVKNFNAFISGTSYTEWLTTFADQIYRGDFITKESQLFRFQESSETSLTTDGITISAKTCFMPELSSISTSTFFHTYQITMVMAKDVPASKSCQLESRHWIVIDENGVEDRVSGPGVVGDFPTMRPGTEYSWVSCTTFPTTYGSMKGHFTMRNLSNGLKHEVYCPTFHMKCLPYVTAAQCTA